jgi:two-component system response regulator HydG
MESTDLAYLTMVGGSRANSRILLKRHEETRLGRGTDCEVLVDDPRCSRVHAVIFFRDHSWWLRDYDSTNGTFVNDQKVDEVQLVDGNVVQIGRVRMQFHLEPSSEDSDVLTHQTLNQTIIRQESMGLLDTHTLALEALRESPRAHDFLTLYRLCYDLLGCVDPDDVVKRSLEVVHQRLHASVVGFLWVDEAGKLRPKLCLPPESAGTVHLSNSLTKSVCRQGQAVWLKTQSSPDRLGDSLVNFKDAICVPLLAEGKTVGAIHIYLREGVFEPQDFEFAVSIANLLSVALVRARQQATLAAAHKRLIARSGDFDEMIGESKAMRDLKSKITRVAMAAGCVLVRGESGAGKELVARALHRAGSRADRPLLAVNCAALPRDLMESQLFGHKKGAFTGANADHIGWFQQADSGTLFLDEVGELTIDAQAKFLRILEGHPFLPVGGTKEVRVDVRIIAATNRDLAELVREGRFRQDLYYRLSAFELSIPPLRERGEDIDRLLDFFLEHFKTQHGRPTLQLAKEAREKLRRYRWPGNIRQLRNVIDSAVVLADGDLIQPLDLGLHDVGGSQPLDTLDLNTWEQKLIREALGRSEGNVPEAAGLLGISRATLYRKIEEYGIER